MVHVMRERDSSQGALRPILSVEMWPVDRPKPYPGNPRIITQTAVEKVAAALRTFGWRQPIVVDRDDVIIVGHTRLRAAVHLGMTEVPVHVAHDLTEAEAQAYRLADNRVGEETRWDLDALMVDLDALGALDFDLTLTGFDPTELPGPPPSFEPLPAEDVKRLDRRAAINCPSCGHSFEP